MAQRIYLHIGAHKTGTTAVQYALNWHRDALLEAGILFPAAAQYQFSQHRLAFGLSGRRSPDTDTVPQPDEEMAAIEAEIVESRAPTIILSSELFFSLGADEIGWLRERLDDFDVTVVACIRRQDELFSSLYNQRVKDFGNDFWNQYADFLPALEAFSPDLDFAARLDGWAEAFGRANMVVQCYERVDDMRAYILSQVGLNAEMETTERPIASNPSLSVQALEIVRQSKALTPDIKKRERIYQAARQCFDEKNAHRLMHLDEHIRILEHFRDGNAHVFKTYFGSENLYDPKFLIESPMEPRIRLTVQDTVRLLVDMA
ncbi:hypothetical protein HW532_05580 [Kaustia mangrovi]|uniref:Sulfotransferase domain-containing protein n=1 Tax=Kaustia mangrovi TaxID=2593653 RepID=A0A7S8C2L6_9HYPH|nr:hypothetical protein [Kaustia mangrovi]QPC42219.1 hypothetical protein HW532_05580 [Kaustia mangrovi]